MKGLLTGSHAADGQRRRGRRGGELAHRMGPPRPETLPRFLPLCPQGSEVLEQVLHTLSKSGSLEELVLDNAGLKT